MDEVASVMAAWEEEVLELWEEKPNLVDNEKIVIDLHTLSGGLIHQLCKYLQQIAIAQLENTLDLSSKEGFDSNKVLGMPRSAILNSDKK